MTFHRPKGHAGGREEVHTGVAGESLSKIAPHYRSQRWTDLADWRPIYHFTRERTGSWHEQHKPRQLDNPDLIHPGDVLVNPHIMP
jgi:nucleoid-associated protein YgaU